MVAWLFQVAGGPVDHGSLEGLLHGWRLQDMVLLLGLAGNVAVAFFRLQAIEKLAEEFRVGLGALKDQVSDGNAVLAREQGRVDAVLQQLQKDVDQLDRRVGQVEDRCRGWGAHIHKGEGPGGA